jgi:hypothetical protein
MKMKLFSVGLFLILSLSFANVFGQVERNFVVLEMSTAEW